jgi:general secretion pathway protein B
MSFILDALRKSEAARRRSEAPDLFAHMPQAQPPPQARPRWPWWALGAAVAIALAIAVGLLTRRTQAPVAAAPAVETGDIADASQAGADEVAIAQADATARPEPAPDQPPPPAQVVAAAPIAATPPPAPAAVATQQATQPAAPPQPAPPPVSAPATAPVATPAPPPSGDRIVSPAELEPALRRELPALKLSMHLWNETPARRFIILDGQRLKEGDVLGEGVSGEIVVERIDRDGAVLAWRGLRLRIE